MAKGQRKTTAELRGKRQHQLDACCRSQVQNTPGTKPSPTGAEVIWTAAERLMQSKRCQGPRDGGHHSS
ncbi:hypothetical protein RRG08_030144 [Elysia crispata]|uniref:Uncharacterized protein n=1 Tax=Elysia crispata TaxID=231223 RepID=A0AAE1DKQ8_9GAST|nr:hypothetical protein RRG08_030144 [Elysia crispata]